MSEPRPYPLRAMSQQKSPPQLCFLIGFAACVISVAVLCGIGLLVGFRSGYYGLIHQVYS